MDRIGLGIHPLHMMIRIFTTGILAVTLGVLSSDILSLLADTKMTIRDVVKSRLGNYASAPLPNIYGFTSFMRIISQ